MTMSDLNPTDLLELAARVEGGEGEDRDLDIAIWRLFEHKAPDNRVPLPWLHCYTSSIDAVTALLERLLPGWFWRVGVGSHAGPWAHLNRIHPDNCLPGDEFTSYAKTPTRSLLACLLRALSTQQED